MSTVTTSTPRVLTKGSASGGQPRSAPRPGQRTSDLTPRSTPLLCSEDSITTTVSPPETLPLARMGEVANTPTILRLAGGKTSTELRFTQCSVSDGQPA